MKKIIVANDYSLLESTLKKIINNQYLDNEILRLDYNQQILDIINQSTLFEQPKLIVIKEFDDLSSSEKIKQAQSIIDFIKKDNISYILITSKLSTSFKDETFEIVNIESINKKNKKMIIDEILKSKNMKLNPPLYELLLQNTNDDYLIIKNEIEKINLLLKANVNDLEIKSIICNYHDENIFKLVEAILLKDKNTIFKIYDDIKLKKQDEIAVIAIISNQLNQVLMCKKMMLQKMHNQDIAKILCVTSFAIMNLMKLLYNIKLDEIKSLVNSFFQLELDIKNMNVDKVLGFKNCLINLCIKNKN